MSAALRVALVHSFPASGAPGTEGDVLREQERALRAAGHEVAVIADGPDDLARSASSWASGRFAAGGGVGAAERLAGFAPDVVHAHHLSPSPYRARSWLRGWTGPLVATLHHHRTPGGSGSDRRVGDVCGRCVDGDPWGGGHEGCCRGPRTAHLPPAWSGRGGGAVNPLLTRADRLVVLSELSRRTYESTGVPGGRLAFVPNFVPDAPRVNSTAGKGRWLFVGDLGADTGALGLLRRWPQDVPLDVVGCGELEVDCRAAAAARGVSVRFLGALKKDDLRRCLPSWRGLVFPGRCPESAPPVYAEALAAGLPVLAFEGSSVATAVRAEGTGAVTGRSGPVGPVLRECAARFPALRAHCVRVFAARYAEPVWVARTTALYASVLAGQLVGCPAGLPGGPARPGRG